MRSEFAYTFNDLANLLAVQPKNIRTWERYVPLSSNTKKTDRLYTEDDLKRLSFVQKLLSKGLSITYLSDYLALYPCWLRDDCPECMSKPTREDCAKPCWKEKGMLCKFTLEKQDICKKCKFNKRSSSNVIRLSQWAH